MPRGVRLVLSTPIFPDPVPAQTSRSLLSYIVHSAECPSQLYPVKNMKQQKDENEMAPGTCKKNPFSATEKHPHFPRR